MCRASVTLYTESQIKMLLQRWQCSEPLPPKGKKVVIAFPGKQDFDVDLIEVEKTELTATYGGRLYRAIMSSKAGREIDRNIQESHVVTFRKHQAEVYRMRNIERYHQSMLLSEAI